MAIITLPLSAIAQTARIQSIAGKGKVRVQREKRTDWTLAQYSLGQVYAAINEP
ncbi:hypothetical protein [Nostoc sp. CCY 9925]|uniref:hypothetical protein n=1 Tax=Nostoc sp. CCY 9925 TaxID=3103865 RepID=UPI0039C6A6AE